MTIINEERNYQGLKESTGMMNSQENDAKKRKRKKTKQSKTKQTKNKKKQNNLIEESKKIGFGEVVKRKEFVNNSLKSQI